MPTHVFSTALGRCALRWEAQRLLRFALPDPRIHERDTEAPAASPPPPWVVSLATRVVRHLAGEAQDFAAAPFDWESVTHFQRRVYVATMRVPAGTTATYGQIAAAIGETPGSSRAVAAALGANPWPLLVPCHRIIGARGRLTGFSAPGGIATKLRLLQLEGAELFTA